MYCYCFLYKKNICIAIIEHVLSRMMGGLSGATIATRRVTRVIMNRHTMPGCQRIMMASSSSPRPDEHTRYRTGNPNIKRYDRPYPKWRLQLPTAMAVAKSVA